MSDAPSASCRLVQKALLKRVSREHVGQPYIAEYRSDEVAGRSLSRGCLGGRDQPDSARLLVDVHLHEVMARPGRRELDEVKADAPPAARRHRQGEEEAGRWEGVGFDALAGRACPYVLLHGGGQA